MSVGGRGAGGFQKIAYSSGGQSGRPFILEDPERRINQVALLHSRPRCPIAVLSFSNPQAHIVVDGYHFEWMEGDAKHSAYVDVPSLDTKVIRPLLSPAKGAHIQSLLVLVDTRGVITEAAVVTNVGNEVVLNFSFGDRYAQAWRPRDHLEWTQGTTIQEAAGGGDPTLALPTSALEPG